MDVALSIVGSLLRSDPPQNIIGVIRHVRSTLMTIHDKTIPPRTLLRKITPMLPESFQSSITKILQDEELFEHIWDDMDRSDVPKNDCFCF